MATFTIPLRNKQLSISVDENQIELISRPIRCGQKFEREITRRIGVKKEHREDLEANVGASLGIKDIAQLESSIKSSVGQTFTFEEATEIKDKITVEAPPHGRLNLLIYQVKQTFYFECTENWLGIFRKTWTLTIEKWLERYIDQTTRVEYDPACGEEPKDKDIERKQPNGTIVILLEGNKYAFLTEYVQDGNQVHIPSLGLTTDASIEKILSGSAQVKAEVLPPYARFLANATTPQINISFMPTDIPIARTEKPVYPPYVPHNPIMPQNTLPPYIPPYIPPAVVYPSLPNYYQPPQLPNLPNFNPYLQGYDPNWSVRGITPLTDPTTSPTINFYTSKYWKY